MDDEDKPTPLLQTAGDRFLSKLAIAASAIPGLGGVFAQALSNHSAEQVEARLFALIQSTTEYIASLGDRVRNLEQLEERRQEQVYAIIRETATTNEKEKLRRLRNALVNTLLTDIDDLWFALLQDCLNQVTTQEIRIIDAFYSLTDSVYRANGDRRYIPFSTLAAALPGVPEEALRAVVQRALRLNLLQEVGMGVTGVAPLEYLDKTILGRQFVLHVADPAEAVKPSQP